LVPFRSNNGGERAAGAFQKPLIFKGFAVYGEAV
jgi:hypothetical protein